MATVLCIDDDPRILELQDAVLSSSGYTVLTALDGFTGLALTRSHSIDAIVLDCNMTGMDGSRRSGAHEGTPKASGRSL